MRHGGGWDEAGGVVFFFACGFAPWGKLPACPTRQASWQLAPRRDPARGKATPIVLHARPRHHLPRTEHVLDFANLAPQEQHVRHIELVSLRAGGFDDEVAGPEAEDPVAEQVAALFLDGHA